MIQGQNQLLIFHASGHLKELAKILSEEPTELIISLPSTERDHFDMHFGLSMVVN